MSTEPVGFKMDRAWQVHEQVSMRPEKFGALLYNFGTRRLSLVKSPTLLAAVRLLDSENSARAACLRAGVSEGELPSYRRALAALAASETIKERTSG